MRTKLLQVLKLARNHLRDEDFSHIAWAITGRRLSDVVIVCI
jgi:hypothetical protein